MTHEIDLEKITFFFLPAVNDVVECVRDESGRAMMMMMMMMMMKTLNP